MRHVRPHLQLAGLHLQQAARGHPRRKGGAALSSRGGGARARRARGGGDHACTGHGLLDLVLPKLPQALKGVDDASQIEGDSHAY